MILDQYGQPAVMATAIYEGATTGRRLSGWGTGGWGPNTALYGSLANLRNRTRELTRSNPIADGGVDTQVANLIGRGITPTWNITHKSKSKNKTTKKSIQELWSRSCSEMDADGVCDFYGMQALATRAMIEGGEVFGIVRPRSRSYGLSVPLQLQLIEGDHLDEGFNSLADNGNEIRMGIEYNKEGDKTAYHFFAEHPGENFLTSTYFGKRVRVPAENVIHMFRPLRPGQKRGRPWLASAILKFHDLDKTIDAQVMRTMTTAMFGGFIRKPGGNTLENMGRNFGQQVLIPGTETVNAEPIIEFEPGTFPCLPDGWDVTFCQPGDVGGNFLELCKQELRSIAKGMGITYEQLTGDLSGANFASMRCGIIEVRRLMRMIINHTIVFQFCRRWAGLWMDAAVLSGALQFNDYMQYRHAYVNPDWQPDAWDMINPVDDVNSDKLMIRSGLKSQRQVQAERNNLDPDALNDEIQASNEDLDERGIVLDTAPRKVTSQGQAAQAVAGYQDTAGQSAENKKGGGAK